MYSIHQRTVRHSTINTPLAPAAIGPYNQAILAGDTLYCSGQIALHPRTGTLITGTVADETERVLKNLGTILNAAGMDYTNVVYCTVYLTDMSYYAQVTDVYATYFSARPPGRTTVEVRALLRDARVEISCVAVR